MRGALSSIVAALALSMQPAGATDLLLHGKVVMDDGTPPGRAVSIERQCLGAEARALVATTNRKGEFTWHVTVNSFGVESLGSGFGFMGEVCFLKAALPGYESSQIDLTDRKWSSDPGLPELILYRGSTNPGLTLFSDSSVPESVARTWSQAAKAARSKDWPEAERLL
ncbi:MAG: hypothetical protein M3O35_13150, partial [Acidobacteriota bacterium]|nr:hypothetical protein [Acidobacteriota bacterium]